MFDAHIQYFCYNNLEGDDFEVGHLGNKESWVHLMNTWNRNDNIKTRYTVEEWDELTSDDLRGCVLAEVVPDDQDFVVTWYDELTESSAIIKRDGKIIRENSDLQTTSVPHWLSRLKKQLLEA